MNGLMETVKDLAVVVVVIEVLVTVGFFVAVLVTRGLVRYRSTRDATMARLVGEIDRMRDEQSTFSARFGRAVLIETRARALLAALQVSERRLGPSTRATMGELMEAMGGEIIGVRPRRDAPDSERNKDA